MIAQNNMPDRIHVMHLTDTLDVGGRERIVVDLANGMPQSEFCSSICTTRRDGPLLADVADHVGHLCLGRTRTLQIDPIRTLARYIREQQVDVLHAHGSSLLVARMVSLIEPTPVVVWHDHYGTNDQQERSVLLFRFLSRHVSGVLAVSDSLADWSRRRLGFPADRVWCLPNCVDFSRGLDPAESLPGKPGRRVVSVANLRPAKDHQTLVRAFGRVIQAVPDAHLLLVGSFPDGTYHRSVVAEIERLSLQSQISLLGPRNDVPSILRACDVGVLSSISEGLPVSLLEYGAAGLAVVATDVGQCSRVLQRGRVGQLVPSGSAEPLGVAIASLLADPETRQRYGNEFQRHVAENYSVESVIGQLSDIYSTLLAQR